MTNRVAAQGMTLRATKSAYQPPLAGAFGLFIAIASVATFAAVWELGSNDEALAGSVSGASQAGDTEIAAFTVCHRGGGTNCVVDGDTIWYRGTKIRIADIDTPETHPPRCESEAQLGSQATLRMQALLNAGAFSLQPIDRDTDRYGRALRIVTRDGQSIGGMLVDEGLARWYDSGRRPWC